MKQADQNRLHDLASQLYAEEYSKAGVSRLPFAWSRDERTGRVVIAMEFRQDGERAIAALAREFAKLGD